MDDTFSLIVDAKDIINSFDGQGNATRSDVATYKSATFVDNDRSKDILSFTGFLDQKVTTSDLFDLRGNAEHSIVETYYMDKDQVKRLYETQDITNLALIGGQKVFDIHDRSYHSTIETTYRDYDALGAPTAYPTETQDIYTSTYDYFGNAISQKVFLKDSSGALIEFKSITNDYGESQTSVTRARGNAVQTTIIKYQGFTGAEGIEARGDETKRIERQEIYNNSFDLRGNVTEEKAETYVVDIDGMEKLSDYQLIHNDPNDHLHPFRSHLLQHNLEFNLRVSFLDPFADVLVSSAQAGIILDTQRQSPGFGFMRYLCGVCLQRHGISKAAGRLHSLFR